MNKITFNDLLTKNGILPNEVLYIRHAFSDKGFKKCLKLGYVYEYTCHQKKDFSKNKKYWAVFIGEKNYTARFYRLYEVKGVQMSNLSLAPTGFPYPEWFEKGVYYRLEEIDTFIEYHDKVTIKWNKGRSFYQHADRNDKEIITINETTTIAFPGYENLIISYNELKKVVSEEYTYSQYHTALSNINAVYLIVDTESGKQYIGSSYGNDGLLGRWKCYVDTTHGNNKRMKELICNHPDRYHMFQFSILKILPLTITPDEAVHFEGLFKQKLLTKEFGLNNN